jgi:hypothetical protein
VFFLLTFWSFSPFQIALNSFPAERAVVRKERTEKYYKLSAYMVAKVGRRTRAGGARARARI